MPQLEKKICSKCGVEKEQFEFARNSAAPSGYRRVCKDCRNKQSRLSYARTRGVRVRPWERIPGIDNTGRHLRYKYGMTPADLEDLITSQSNKCPLCGREFGPGQPPQVDHDHKCCPGRKTCGNCIRGVLCRACNVSLGYYELYGWDKKLPGYLQESSTTVNS